MYKFTFCRSWILFIIQNIFKMTSYQEPNDNDVYNDDGDDVYNDDFYDDNVNENDFYDDDGYDDGDDIDDVIMIIDNDDDA